MTADEWYDHALALQRQRRYEQACDAYRQALALHADAPEEVHLNLAVVLAQHLARPDAAAAELQRALALNPGYLPAWLNLGNLHEQGGRRAAARQAYERVLALQPGQPLALARRLGLATPVPADDPALAEVQEALARPGLAAADAADLGFALGQALDAAGEADAAFAAFATANRASRVALGGVRFDRQAHTRFVDSLMRDFAEAADAADTADDEDDAAVPVFVCGLFRSGSSLAEQILASHPGLAAGGEIEALPALVRDARAGRDGLRWPPDTATLQQMRRRYRARLAALRHDGRRLIDKRVDNFLHIGLIKALFPRARIVHTRRHALDNALSIWFAHLGPGQPWALDLDDTGHWVAEQRRLMAHWQALYPADLHTLDLEHLVAAPREAVAALLAHLGLPWDEACLQFHRRPSQVLTPSAWQVREPLHGRTAGRWRRYERHLGGLVDRLGPLV